MARTIADSSVQPGAFFERFPKKYNENPGRSPSDFQGVASHLKAHPENYSIISAHNAQSYTGSSATSLYIARDTSHPHR